MSIGSDDEAENEEYYREALANEKESSGPTTGK